MKVDVKIEPKKPPIVILEAETPNEEESLQLLAGFKRLRFRVVIEEISSEGKANDQSQS